MLDGEWVLTYPGTSLSFGGFDPITNPFRLPQDIYMRAAPQIGEPNTVSDDTDRPRMDGTAMGADYRGGRTITFDIGCRASTEAAALELAATVQGAWRGDSVRLSPGAYATLATNKAGRERLVYGRPRRCVPNYDTSKTGLVTLLAEFATHDDQFYDVTDTAISVQFAAAPSTGIISPVVTPVTTTPIVYVPGGIDVDGRQAAWPVMAITGPIINPKVTVTGRWSLELQATIPAGVTVTIDTRPHRRRVTRNSDGASYAGALTRASRLDRCSLQPGPYEVVLSGRDNTGLSKLQFAWRPAWPSL